MCLLPANTDYAAQKLTDQVRRLNEDLVIIFSKKLTSGTLLLGLF